MSVKHETIEVSGVVIYCDGCGVRGPEEAYDNLHALFDDAEADGWDVDDDPRHLCSDCVKKAKKTRKR